MLHNLLHLIDMFYLWSVCFHSEPKARLLSLLRIIFFWKRLSLSGEILNFTVTGQVLQNVYTLWLILQPYY